MSEPERQLLLASGDGTDAQTTGVSRCGSLRRRGLLQFLGGVAFVGVILCIALPLTLRKTPDSVQASSPSHNGGVGSIQEVDLVSSFLADFEENYGTADCDDPGACLDPGCSRHGDCSDPWTRARRLLRFAPLIDTHNDLAWSIRSRLMNRFSQLHLEENLTETWPGSRTDIPRLRAGQLGGQFWSCYVSCSSQYRDAVRLTMDQCDVIRRFIDKYPDVFEFVDSSENILRSFRNGKIASLIGIEGGHSIDSSLGTLRQFYKLGSRYLTLTHTCDTPWADCSLADVFGSGAGTNDGLSEFGEVVVKELNRLGMFVDISHVSKATMEDALRVSRAPVIFSHSSSWQLCHHHRNVQDDVLRKLKDNGGIIMVSFVSEFTNCYPSNHTGPTTLSDVADHIEHIRSVAGSDHIGLGADYDGVDTYVEGLEDVSAYPALFVELISRGWSDYDLSKLAGLNLIRVFRDMEKVRDSMQDVAPFDDHVPPPDLPDRATFCRKDF